MTPQQPMRCICGSHLRSRNVLDEGYLTRHIVSLAKFHRIGGAPPETFPNVKYDAPEEVGGDRKCFDSPGPNYLCK